MGVKTKLFVKLGTFQFVLLAASGALLSGSPAAFASGAAISGVVRDSSGMPQMDVVVQLLRIDSSIIQAVRTDARGRYSLAGILPGTYQLKAVETAYLPTLRENLKVGIHGRNEVNLTVSTLLEALQWIPIQKRNASEPEEDWMWTLRSAAYRPLLRFVGEDGLETIESPHTSPQQHHGRILIESGQNAFGEGGPTETAEYRHHSADGSQSLVRGQVSDDPAVRGQWMAGYGHENTMGSGMSTVLAYASDPSIASSEGGSLHTLQLRSMDTMRLMPDVKVEVGSQFQMIGVGTSSNTYMSPFAEMDWQQGDSTLSYALTTTPLLQNQSDLTNERSLAPSAVMHGRTVGIEHGLHQELKFEHASESSVASVAIYQDSIVNPIVDGAGHLEQADLLSGGYLFDPESGVARVSGSDYSARGMVVKVSHKGPASTTASMQFATGSALGTSQAPAASRSSTIPDFKSHHAAAVAWVLQGASSRTATNWRASYRWQPARTVNAVDLYDSGMADAYLSLFLRQSLHLSQIFPGGVDAVVNVQNLLAEGYHPFLTSDGSTLFFAQVNRSVRGGLCFYF